jgi:hypothetical protein
MFISCRCCSIGLEQVNRRAEIQSGITLTAFSRSLSRMCPTLLPGQMTDCQEALRRWHYIFVAKKPLVGHGLLIIVASRSHSRHSTLGRTPLVEWSVRRRDLYLTAHNTHNRMTSVSPVGFEPATLANEWPQNHALDGVTSGIGRWYYIACKTAYF